MAFPNKRRRTVVLEVNAVNALELWILQRKEDVQDNPEIKADREAGRANRGFELSMLEWADTPLEDMKVTTHGRSVTFLCACKPGRDTIEFGVEGAFELVAVGGDCYVFSKDSQQHEHKVFEPEIYTRLANRRQRNPHLEMMMFEMKRNQMAFQQQLLEDNERRIKAMEEGRERYVKQRDQRPPTERSLAALAAARASATATGDAERTGTTPGGEGEAGGGVPGDADVSKAAPKSRAKAEKAT